mmetsp:Transcript_4089/g.9722  ORF Transcript_4089/g.9722 Transcript_4089/m.9722 type:complete len:290 (-) Transcript_4089:402-1271(-)
MFLLGRCARVVGRPVLPAGACPGAGGLHPGVKPSPTCRPAALQALQVLQVLRALQVRGRQRRPVAAPEEFRSAPERKALGAHCEAAGPEPHHRPRSRTRPAAAAVGLVATFTAVAGRGGLRKVGEAAFEVGEGPGRRRRPPERHLAAYVHSARPPVAARSAARTALAPVRVCRRRRRSGREGIGRGVGILSRSRAHETEGGGQPDLPGSSSEHQRSPRRPAAATAAARGASVGIPGGGPARYGFAPQLHHLAGLEAQSAQAVHSAGRPRAAAAAWVAVAGAGGVSGGHA